MIRYILGAKGAGKTKWLIDHANEDHEGGNGNIAFVEVDDDHIFSLDYNVRLINATEYNLTNLDEFYGFLSGMYVEADFPEELKEYAQEVSLEG